MAAVVQALHLTPGRRLLSCLEKLKSCVPISSNTAPMHPLVTPLLDLLKGEAEGNSSVQALSAAVGCVQDVAISNVDQLLLHLVHTLMSCSDYKVRDMGHRHELKFVVTKTNSGCSHRPCDKTMKQQHYAVTLRLKQFEGGEVSAVQNALDNSLKTEYKETCDECKVENVSILRRHINAHCDPDFLTLLFDDPRNLLKSDLILQLSESTYAVKVVTHWDEVRQKAAVSVQRSDGWWWHGIDMDQASQYRYTEKQTSLGNNISKAIVLMCVRVVPYAENNNVMEDLLDIENSQEDMDCEGYDEKNVDWNDEVGELGDICNALGDCEEYEQGCIGKDATGKENQRREQSRNYGLREEGCSDPTLLYDFGAAVIESRQNNPNLETLTEKIGSGGPSWVNANIQFERDIAAAQAVSRKESPGCLTAEQVIGLGIRTAARLGILCRRPNLPLDGNSFIPMDGNCTFSCFTHANDPTLRGRDFKEATWELRIRAVGSGIERLKHLNDEQWALLQGIVTKDGEDTMSKEEIKVEMEKYMESGQYSGNLGDILPQLAADFLEQPLLVIEIKNCKVTNLSLVKPGGLFGAQIQCEGFLVIVIKQMNHYESLLIATEARETAMEKYRQWNDSGIVGVTSGEQLNDSFHPSCAPTRTEGHGEDSSRNEQRTQSGLDAGISSHSQSTEQVIDKIRLCINIILYITGSLRVLFSESLVSSPMHLQL